MTRNALILVAAAGLAAAILILWRGSGATEPSTQDQAVIALGQRLYAENCATCHGADLEGQPDWQTPLANGRYPAPPHDETGHTWHHADALLERIIRDAIRCVISAGRPVRVVDGGSGGAGGSGGKVLGVVGEDEILTSIAGLEDE